jgi:cephalosporin hydroxylase
MAANWYESWVAPRVRKMFFRDLVKRTDNFGKTTWLGNPIWQNVLDLWTIQETIAEVKPELLIECGTNRGGSALFYAHLFDLMGKGKIISMDIEKMHDHVHPRVEFLIGDSTGEEMLSHVRKAVAATKGPILVILDSNHEAAHVYKELQLYSGFVTPDSFCLVQDGVIDVLPIFEPGRPGPLVALEKFLKEDDRFIVDDERNNRFLITHHPSGWLKRKAA